MCGIFSYISKYLLTENVINTHGIYSNFKKIKDRGPTNTQHLLLNNIYLGFHRLAINDLSDKGNQPMKLNNYFLICNGEIFNYKDLQKQFNFKLNSNSDCEIILHLYNYFINTKNYNSKKTINTICNLLDAEFSFILHDTNKNKTFIARDPYGVRPLFIGNTEFGDYVFSSELKGIVNLVENAKQFEPGTFMSLKNPNMEEIVKNKSIICHTAKYHYINTSLIDIADMREEIILNNVNKLFTEAVKKRMMSDQEICSLLSGGLDSSLVSAILSKQLGPNKLKTFAIGLKGSPDLKYAQEVANHIKSIHYNIEISEKEFLEAIEEVIYKIESYDITTVRASVGNYLIGKYISNNTDCKVVFNGDFSDEIAGGYKYFKNTNNSMVFHEECLRLLNNIHYFDCLRSDRSISTNGLESRVPFADKKFIDYYMSIEPSLRMSNKRIEKYLIRKAFDKDNLLPTNVLWRKKEAFSDGVTSETRSWHKIIEEYIDTKIDDNNFNILSDLYIFNKPTTKESLYYRIIFERNYNKFDNVIPYFWMPKWCGNISDPSAREIRCID
jgi:asparagine synthase (glutamine-hydrolysing)